MHAMITRRRITLTVTLLLLLASVSLSGAFGMNAGTVTGFAVCGAIVAGIGAVLCGVFVRTPPDSFEHSIARSSLVALATLPPALALRATLVGALDVSPIDRSRLVIASSAWLVVAAVFTAGVLHLAERREASRRATAGHHGAPLPRGA